MPIREHIEPDVIHIIQRLVQEGYEAYIVGGAVRDLLLNIQPKDYDIATSAHPEEVKRVFRRRARIIGRRFRLVHVYTEHHYYEVSTFRREPTPEERKGREYDDGVMIWRDNEYGTLEQDAHRRDFTVNALYYDPIGERGVIDLVGGVADLEARVVRSIGPARLRMLEDPVRLIRACKLCAQYDFRLTPELEEAFPEAAPRIRLCSMARLLEEVLKILAKPWSHRTFEVMLERGLLPHLWPRLARIWTTEYGEFLQRLLTARDERTAAGDMPASRTLALATVVLPAVEQRLGDGPPGTLWDHRVGIERPCREAVCTFFSPLRVSRYLAARIRDLLLLLARFDGPVRGRVIRHPEYPLARELYFILTAARGQPPETAERWPAPRRGRRNDSRDGTTVGLRKRRPPRRRR